MNTKSLPKAVSYHRAPMRLLNGVWQGLNTVGIAKVNLNESALIAQAKKETGLASFGDEAFMEPMRILLNSLETEADLNPVGRFLNRVNILRLLKHRLYAAELIKQHPEILERKMPTPIVIAGLARSGTTRLHRLLASDDRFLHMKAWESVNPVPYPESFSARDAGKVDPRISSIEQGLKAVLYMSPQIAAVHPLGAHEIEEEIGLIQHGFSSQIFEVQARMPTFSEWLMTNQQHAAYEYMVLLMKIISWYRDDPEDKPWILKTPQHMQDLDSLMHVFPDAKVIFPHRDPVKCVGSACSMAWNAIVRDSSSITAEWVGQEWFNKTERMLKKTIRVRDEMVPKNNQYDVQYADIGSNWLNPVEGIYQFLEMPLLEKTKMSMQAWLDSNEQHKHGAHKYKLTDFGLNNDEVDQKMMFYRERFNIPYEVKNPNIKETSK